MVDAKVLADFTDKGTQHRKGEQITISEAEYVRLAEEGVIGPTGDPKTVTNDVIGPTSDER